MTDEVVHRFVEALGRLEGQGELRPLIDLFSDDAELSTSAVPRALHGRDGALRFWRAYREAFSTVASEFVAASGTAGRAFLEWRTEGTWPEGGAFSYRGVTVLEIADGRIVRCSAYFDPGELTHRIALGSPAHTPVEGP